MDGSGRDSGMRSRRWRRLGTTVAALVAVSTAGCGGGGGGQSGQPLEQATVSGAVTYDRVPTVLQDTGDSQTGRLDFASTIPTPVRGAVVEVLQGSSTTPLTSTTTDDAGHYSLTFQAMSNGGSLQVIALAKTLNPPIQVEDNTNGNAIWAIGAPVAATGGTVDLHATHGWNATTSTYDPAQRKAAFFAILDSMTTAARAVLGAPHSDTLPAIALPELKVNWSPDNVPGSGNVDVGFIGTSHFNPATREIFILGKAPVMGVSASGVDSDEFDDHVIVHEWGHFLEDAISRSDSPGGQHGAEDMLDPRLSWSEGFGDAIPAMLLGSPLYVDTGWSGTIQSAFGFDAETGEATDDPLTLDGQPLRGPFSEFTVMRLLYDLFDASTATEGFDGVALGVGPILDAMRGPQTTADALVTLGWFVSGLRGQPGVSDTTLNPLLDYYSVGHITNAFGAGDPDLEGIYTPVPGFLFQASRVLAPRTLGESPNKRENNQYYVFTGNGANVTVTTSVTGEVGCNRTTGAGTCLDVDVAVVRAGNLVGETVSFSGNETLTVPTVNGATYVAVLTSWKTSPGSFTTNISFSSP
jgi:hypothetical protein